MAYSNTIVGLDLGNYAVKAVWIDQRGRTPAVKRREFVRVPPDGAEREDIIRRWIAKLGLARTPCVIGLPCQRVMFQPFLLPPGDPRHLEQAAAMEVLQFNEMASETMVYDFCEFETTPETRRILLAMARPSVLEDVLRLAREMQLQVVDLVPSPVALFNALAPSLDASPEPQLLINVGHSSTEVAIGGGTGLMFARATAAGGQLFTEAIARARDLSYSQAENIKLGQDGGLRDGSALADDMQRAATMWASEIKSCLSVYRSAFSEGDMQPSRVVLCGGGARLHGMAEFVSERLGLTTTLADSGDAETDFTVAHGLALTGHKTCRTQISLLPTANRDELAMCVQKPFWIAAAVTAALILIISLLGGYRDILRKETMLNAQRTSLRKRQDLVKAIEAAQARSNRIREMAAPIKDMLRGAVLLQDIIELTAGAITETDRITMICDEKSYYEQSAPPASPHSPRTTHSIRTRAPAAPRKEPSNEHIGRIVIEGYTLNPNLSTVRGLIEKLENAPFVESADLLNDDQIVERDGPRNPAASRSRRFVIDVKLKTI